MRELLDFSVLAILYILIFYKKSNTNDKYIYIKVFMNSISFPFVFHFL